MALQIAIVEDLQPDAQRLQALVRQELGAVECGIFPSGDAYLQQMPARKDDLVFLDICMEGTSGIETAQQLRRADPEVLIVFVTSSPEYVWDAFPVHPFDYLLKPYEEESSANLLPSCGGCSAAPSRSWKCALPARPCSCRCARCCTPWRRTISSGW